MKSQREACVNAILAVLSDRGVEYELGGSVNVSTLLTAEDKKAVQTILVAGFNKSEIDLKDDAKKKYIGNTSELNKYVSGLQNNWIRKFPSFNAGTTYQAKNPGSRAGTGDEQVKEMRKLLKITADSSAKLAIQSAIDSRLAEIKPATEVKVNLDAIPAELRAKLGL